jgi:hypothetical protein
MIMMLILLPSYERPGATENGVGVKSLLFFAYEYVPVAKSVLNIEQLVANHNRFKPPRGIMIIFYAIVIA